MFDTEQENSINTAVHVAVVPTEIHTQIKITITKRESTTADHLVNCLLQPTVCPY